MKEYKCWACGVGEGHLHRWFCIRLLWPPRIQWKFMYDYRRYKMNKMREDDYRAAGWVPVSYRGRGLNRRVWEWERESDAD